MKSLLIVDIKNADLKMKSITQTKGNDTNGSSKEDLKVVGFPNEEIKPA